MAVSMRFKKMGSKNNAFFRLVVADARSPRDGKFIEELGWYNPYKDKEGERLAFKKERILYWLSKGVIPSKTVKDLLKKEGIVLN